MKAPDFDLPGVDGKRHSPTTARGANGLLVMFICNHCPYVKRAIDRIIRESSELAAHGIGSIAVMPNDPAEYPEDSFDNMKRVAAQKRFPFPYVIDETQDAARAYITAGWMAFSRRWCRSPAPASAQRSRSRRSAAPSNGRNEEARRLRGARLSVQHGSSRRSSCSHPACRPSRMRREPCDARRAEPGT